MTSAPYTIDLRDLAERIVELGAKRPDFIYSDQTESFRTCSYVGASKGVDGGQPCIVGQALQDLGIPAQALREWEQEGVTDTALNLLTDENFINTDVDHVLITHINWVQQCQDCGLMWGEATTELTEYLAHTPREES